MFIYWTTYLVLKILVYAHLNFGCTAIDAIDLLLHEIYSLWLVTEAIIGAVADIIINTVLK